MHCAAAIGVLRPKQYNYKEIISASALCVVVRTAACEHVELSTFNGNSISLQKIYLARYL